MQKIEIEKYDKTRDLGAVLRIWKEVGWVEDDNQEKAMADFFDGSDVLVARIRGEAECAVLRTAGTIRYLDTVLQMGGITGVTTSRIARKQGLAGRLTAKSIADGALAGDAVSVLGIFEEGYYDQFGYGTAPYIHQVKFDPAHLKTKDKFRVPHRFLVDDYQALFKCLINRRPVHGACNLNPATSFKAELQYSKGGFGLGYYNESGTEISHFIWISGEGEHGPFAIEWFVYNSPAEFKELVALLKSLGDQFNSVSWNEPAGVQIQDLIKQPLTNWRTRSKGKFAGGIQAQGEWQIRICDLQKCIAAVNVPANCSFNLILDDPITKFLPNDCDWQGIGGNYVVNLGLKSTIKTGQDDKLMTLEAGVSGFSRLWLGCRPATGLASTGQLSAPAELIKMLDAVLRLPIPHCEWQF